MSARIPKSKTALAQTTKSLGEVMTPRTLFLANPLERIRMVREGLPASCIFQTASLLHMSPARLVKILGMPRSSRSSRPRACKRLTPDQSERVIALLLLVGQVELIMDSTGDGSADFDAGTWLGVWIDEPQLAFANQSAAELMDTVEGRQLVSRLLAQSAAGAYV